MPAYLKAELVLREGCGGQEAAVRDLQRDLRALGYLACGIDGIYGSNTVWAVRALQYDLLHNTGMCTSGFPAKSPVAMTGFNRDGDGQPLVSAVTGKCDQALAQAIAALIASPDIGRVPECADPAAENREACAAVLGLTDTPVPAPFVFAIVQAESGGTHFLDQAEDRYLIVGLDHDDPAHPERITSRGYGIGQYCLCYHPPGPAEMEAIRTPQSNVRMLVCQLEDLFLHFLIGGIPSATADDRVAAHGTAPLRGCKYDAADPRHMKDCAACARAARRIDIRPGMPLHPGASQTFRATASYATSVYDGVPDAADFSCDWPYALRRYAGNGVDAYHYQVRALRFLLRSDAERKNAAAAGDCRGV